MINSELIFFFSFIAFILIILFIDLGLFSKKYHVVSFRESIMWTILWVSLAISFYFFIRSHGNWIHGIETWEQLAAQIIKYHHPIDIEGLSLQEALKVYNNNLALEYLTGYIIEYALSIDNVFVMILIFISFGVDQRYYKKVLFWGILGAIIMRFLFIFLASALIQKFSWVFYFFGALLFYTAFDMLRRFLSKQEKRIDPKNHPIVRFASKYFRVYPTFIRHKFWIKKDGRIYMTPLFLVLLVIEFTDVIFAVDSVPAIFSVTMDPYVVFFSNIFAIVGLRSLFFLLSNMINRFYYLKLGLSLLLAFVAVKLVLHDLIHISTVNSLIIISVIIGLSILASLIFPKKKVVE